MIFIRAIAFACLAVSVAGSAIRGDTPSVERRLDDTSIPDLCIMCDICDIGGDLCDPGEIADFACAICDALGDDDGADPDEGGGICFSELATVQVFQQGAVQMKDLKVGDRVLTAKNQYETVYAFGHNNPTRAAKFFQIHSERSNRALEITADHMVYVQGQEAPVAAAKIQVGDTLRSSQGESKVTKISTVVRTGIYAPLTTSGTLMVDGIMASSYIALGSKRTLSDHTLVHMTLSPYRMVCTGVSARFCNTDSYNEDGMPHFVEYGLRFLHWMNSCSPFLQAVVLAILVAGAGACWTVELLFGASLAPVVAFLSVVAFTSYQKNNKSKSKML